MICWGMIGVVIIALGMVGAFADEGILPVGIDQMTHVELLPLLRPDVQVHYEGSIDKLGKNADWDWWLYEDVRTKEWVIMEAQGPGCLWNFVVHHAVGHSDPLYRFYFDGRLTPGFEIRHSEFGLKPPFITPLADKFLPQVAKDPRLQKIDFQIVRSFCPMPFAKSLKITSSLKLQGNHSTGGGWGHAIWHSYPGTEAVRTFTGKEDYSKLLDLWKRCGEDPKPRQGNEEKGFSVTVYCYWPMPFWRSAKIDLENRGLSDSSLKISGTVVFKPASALAYPKARTGHFRTSAYQAITPKKSGRDSHVATLRGSGHVVAGLITAEQSMCEGDVRVHIDGCGTAAVESDGSESWACYGWGFEFPPQSNPASSYDGKGNSAWSMLRLLMGDFYPFRKSLRMTVEGGGGDESGVDPRSGVVFYYGEPEPAMILTDFLDVGDLESEKKHEYTATGSNVWNLISSLAACRTLI